MKLEVRQVNGAARLELSVENSTDQQQLREFVEQLNGGPLDNERGAGNPIFDCPVRVESVGFADDGSVESVAIEGPRP